MFERIRRNFSLMLSICYGRFICYIISLWCGYGLICVFVTFYFMSVYVANVTLFIFYKVFFQDPVTLLCVLIVLCVVVSLRSALDWLCAFRLLYYCLAVLLFIGFPVFRSTRGVSSSASLLFRLFFPRGKQPLTASRKRLHLFCDVLPSFAYACRRFLIGYAVFSRVIRAMLCALRCRLAVC